MAKKFGQVLSPQKGQKHSKNDLTAPILTHRKQSWEIEVLEGQMTSKSRNFTCLEIIQVGLSNELSWDQFGLRKVPQNQLQSGATHREFGCGA